MSRQIRAPCYQSQANNNFKKSKVHSKIKAKKRNLDLVSYHLQVAALSRQKEALSALRLYSLKKQVKF